MSFRVLVAVDMSEESHRVVRAAARLMADRVATIDVMHVAARVAAPTMGHPAAAAILGSLIHPETQDMAELEALMALVNEANRGQCSVRRGDPAEVIIDEGKKGYDLVVVGTQGRTGLAAVLLGSVAERVVRRSATSVLVVR